MSKSPIPSTEQIITAIVPLVDYMDFLGGQHSKVGFANGGKRVLAIIARDDAANQIEALYEKWSNAQHTKEPPASKPKKARKAK